METGLDMFRTTVTLVLFGLLLGWLFPTITKNLAEKINSQLGSLGQALIAWSAFFLSVPL
ncbi:MAG: hypothetical protein IPJ46_24735 [Anaerolineales bacterium]|nr:hypothetical protein [Anaerolineales bacterium]